METMYPLGLGQSSKEMFPIIQRQRSMDMEEKEKKKIDSIAEGSNTGNNSSNWSDAFIYEYTLRIFNLIDALGTHGLQQFLWDWKSKNYVFFFLLFLCKWYPTYVKACLLERGNFRLVSARLSLKRHRPFPEGLLFESFIEFLFCLFTDECIIIVGFIRKY